MTFNRRLIARGALAVAAVLSLQGWASAQDASQRPIRMVVGYPAGGAADNLARRVAEGMGKALNRSVIVDNKPGANTIIAANALTSAPADGNTIMLATDSTLILNPLLYKSVPYDVAKDFQPVGHIASTPLILTVSPKLPVKTVAELVAQAKRKPGKLNYGTFGKGGSSHIAGELFVSMAAIKAVHVPYPGGTKAQMAKMAGDVQFGFGILGSDMVYVRDHRLTALAVATNQRTRLAPELPTLEELGYEGFDVTPKFGLVTRAGVPAEVVERLNAALNEVLKDKSFGAGLEKLGYELDAPAGPAAYAAEIAKDRQKWARYIERTGITVD